ncbi:translocation/assembly module TamB domain-containing protein [Cohaesibacter intestini]|uniref:translocation/assembly module TamB domain-containing protein n=1 Tax=Cohaesibacter intestini TaxID=2211145 RepID=UPI000DE83A51|nr:translocation/assembly module TamB domain-containing protein [Cohaesibacter intestini]
MKAASFWQSVRPWLKRGLIAVAALFLLIGLSVAGLLGTGAGRSFSADLINRLASSEDQRIEITGLDRLIGGVRIKGLTLADRDGVWLEASDFTFTYSLSDLLSLRLSSDQLSLGRLVVHRAPISAAPDPAPASDGPLIPDLPALRARIEQIAISEIVLGEDLLGKPANLSLAGHLTMEDAPLHVSGALSVAHRDQGDGAIKASWDFLPSENKRQMALELDEPRGGLAARLLDMAALPAVRLSLRGDGPAEDWRSKLSVSLDGTAIVEGGLTAQLTNEAKQIQAALTGNLAPFVPGQLVPLVAGKSQLTLEAKEQDQVITLSTFDFASDLAHVSAFGTVDLANQQLDVSSELALGQDGLAISFQIPDAAPVLVEPIALAMRMQGPLTKARFRAQLAAERIAQGALVISETKADLVGSDIDFQAGQGALTAKLTVASLKTGTAQADSLLEGPIQLTAAVSLADGNLSIAQSQLKGQHLAAEVAGTVAQDELALEGQANVSGLRRIDPQLAGRLLAKFSTSGPPADPAVSLNVTGQDVAIAGKAVEDLILTLTADAAPTLTLDMSGRYDDAPLSVSSRVTSDETGDIAIKDVSIKAPGADISGALTVSPQGIAAGELSVNVAALDKLGPLLLQPDLKGSVTGTLNLNEQGGKQAVSLAARAPDISLPGVRLVSLDLNGSLFDPAGTPATKLTARLDQLTAGGETLRGLEAKIDGSGGQLPFTARASLSGQPLGLDGTFLQEDGQMALALNRLQASWKGIAVKLTEATQIDLSNGARFIKPLTLSIDGGRATLTGAAADTLDLTLSVAQLPLSIADKVAKTGEAISGSLSLEAKVSGASSNPLVRWTGTVSGLSARTMRNTGTPALGIQSEGQFQGSSIVMKNRITGGGADLSLAGLVALEPQRLDLDVKGGLPFGLAARALADAGIRLDGNARIEAKIKGSPSAPDVSGLIRTNGARLIELSSGVVVRDLSGQIVLGKQQARLESFTGRLGKDGTLKLGGTIGIDPQQSLPVDIKLSLRDGAFKHEDILTTQFNADLALKGALAGASVLTGTINLSSTEISIPESLPGSISPVAVEHVNATGKVAEQAKRFKPKEEAGASQGSSIGLDLLIASPRRIYVRGRGLDTEMGGTIRITGTTDSPNPVGSVSLLRGRMDLLSRRLDFDSGTVTFAGSLDPALDFSATTTNAGGSYTLSVGGYASSPEIALSSSPSLPQDEILAQIFFNENISDLSPIQLAQLANAVATLSGANSGPGLVDRLRSLAGIDNIDVKSDAETGETTVGVGRYLNDRTYINVEKGATSNSGKVTIDLEITNQLKARGEADVTGKSKAGIFFERDY